MAVLRGFSPKLLVQLVPAVIVTAVGIALLGNVDRPASPAPEEVAPAAIQAEAVFTATPRAAAEPDTDQAHVAKREAARSEKTKSAAARKVAVNAPASRQAAEPLVIAPTERAQAAAMAPADTSDNTMMGKLRSVTTAVGQIPSWATSSVASWFSEQAPPRPPEPIPAQEFAKTM